MSEEELACWLIGHAPKRLRTGGIPAIRLGNSTFFQLRRDKLAIYRRFQRASWNRPKWTIARSVANTLSFIPSIQCIGVTGGVAMDNAAKEDDIDMLLVATPGTLWATRFLATVLLDALGVRRRPGETRVADKICLNMFVAADHLDIPKEEQDLFAAHELLQMVPVFDRGGAYYQFLKANRWARKFLPNAWKKKSQISKHNVQNKAGRNALLVIGIWVLRFFEKPSKQFQLWYMRKHRTNEVITDSMIRFHPRDARTWIKPRLAYRLRRYHIPLDKVFYQR